MNTAIREIVRMKNENDKLTERYDDLESRLERQLKESEKKETGKQDKVKEKKVPYIPKQILKKKEEEVPTLKAPVIMRD